MSADPDDLETLVHNVRALMKASKIAIPALSKKSGVSPRMIKYILNKQRTPTIAITEAIASVWNLKSWQLMIPDINVEILKDRNVHALVKNYTLSNEKGQDYLDHVAEKEAKYRSTK